MKSRQQAHCLIQNQQEQLTLAEKLWRSPLETAAWYLAIRSFNGTTSWRSDTPSVQAALSSANSRADLSGPTVTERKCRMFRYVSGFAKKIASPSEQRRHLKYLVIKQTVTFHSIFDVSLSPLFFKCQAKLQDACIEAYAYINMKRKCCSSSFSCNYSDEKYLLRHT